VQLLAAVLHKEGKESKDRDRKHHHRKTEGQKCQHWAQKDGNQQI